MKVYIAAGHQGKGTGACKDLVIDGNKIHFDEAEMTEKLVEELKPYFECDENIIFAAKRISLTSKIKEANKVLGCKGVAIEFHFNAAATGHGAECVIADCASEKSKKIATELSELVSKTLNITNRGVKRECQSARGKLGFLNKINSPSVICEIGFVTSVEDMSSYKINFYIFVDAIVDFIKKL